jgi:2-dehydro-3-deoxyphosphogluconate aldolase/(4S)-4-hydroxy-2-oxoglutarate aldolase
VKFCPANAAGGSWVAPVDLVRAKDWAAITARAAEAAALKPRHAGDTPGA